MQINNKQVDFAVFIGRFQPLHLGHQQVIDEALRRARHVIILIGSSFSSRSPRNPFTYNERANMIARAYPQAVAENRLSIRPLTDFPYDDKAWVNKVEKTVNRVVLQQMNHGLKVTLHGVNDASIALIGFAKDHTSYYLKMFPRWSSINVVPTKSIDATSIRNEFFTSGRIDFASLSKSVGEIVFEFLGTPAYDWLVAEHCFNAGYKAEWSQTPYPPTFNTADAVVVHRDKVLLVERGRHPGKGLYAVPGGFVNPHERLFNAAIRELLEETEIRGPNGIMSSEQLAEMIQGPPVVFDAPHRSERGRIFTQAYLFKIPDDFETPALTASDDASDAFWRHRDMLDPPLFFEDHYHIITTMIGN